MHTFLSPFKTIHYYLHCKTILYYPQARVYPIFPIQIFTLLPHWDIQTFSLLYSLHTYTYDPHAMLDPTILFPIFTLIPTCRLWNLYPIISTQRNTLLYWFKSSLYNPYADIQIYSLLSPRQKPNILSRESQYQKHLNSNFDLFSRMQIL